jgi:two-component system chemotaxis response regulator CheY
MTTERPLVLDVGQCNLDHGNISQMLAERFDAVVDRAHSVDDAANAAKDKRYHLVLVNRVFDADGDEGLVLIERLQANEATRDTPVMLVSNFADAQESAVALGAKPGFGKSALNDPKTVQCLVAHLSTSPQREQ